MCVYVIRFGWRSDIVSVSLSEFVEFDSSARPIKPVTSLLSLSITNATIALKISKTPSNVSISKLVSSCLCISYSNLSRMEFYSILPTCTCLKMEDSSNVIYIDKYTSSMSSF